MCVLIDLFVCAHSSIRSAKGVKCSEPSHGFLIRLLCNTHVRAHSSNWSANAQLTSSQHMCVFAHSSNRSARVLKLSKLQLTCSAPDMCVFRNLHMRMPTAAIGRPALDPGCHRQLTSSATHMCVCSQQQMFCQRNVHNLQLASSLDYSATHTCVFTAAIGRPTLS